MLNFKPAAACVRRELIGGRMAPHPTTKSPQARRWNPTWLVAATLLGTAGPLQSQGLKAVVQTSQQTVDEGAASQKRVDQLDAQTQSLVNDYRANLKQLEQLQRYNASQRRQIDAQEREMVSLNADIDSISGLQRSVQPLTEDMLAGLQKLVTGDLPFQQGERRERVERLKRLMDDPSQSNAQRYRLIIEAYQIENEYGRTIEAYRGDIEVDGTKYQNAEFLRIGRLSLVFKTDDDSTLKIFDPKAGAWIDLDDNFLPHVRIGLRMAKELVAPDLLTVPVPAPQAAGKGAGS